MKIVHVLTNLGAGGIEHFVTQVAIRQIAWHNVSVVILARPVQFSNRALEQKHSLEEAGVNVYIMQDHGVKGPVGMALTLRGILRRIAPDIVNMHSYRAVLLIALTTGKYWGGAGKLIYTHHTEPLLIHPVVFRLLDLYITQYITNSAAGARSLTAHTRKPVSVIYHGVIFPDALPSPRRSSDGTNFVVTTVGSLRNEKRHDRIPKIAAELRKSNPHLFARIVFQIAGDGPRSEDLRDDIKRLGLEDHIRLLGERSDVLTLLRRSDVFLLTSDFEGVPISLVEAGWAGLPLVSADAGACKEVLEDGREGYLIAVDDICGYAAALQRLATDPELLQKMSEAAQRIPERFDMNRCLHETDMIYQAVQNEP